MASADVLEAVLTQGREKEVTQEQKDKRDVWVRDLRQLFSPPGMLNDDGSINQQFFKPKQVFLVEERKWGSGERDLLYKGLEQYGVGQWRQIRENLLPQWEEQLLRVRAARLLGSQSLARYTNWRGSREAVEKEFQKNKELGERLGCWKGGILVEDNQGSVAAAFEGQD
eukprot:jgi/Botrbrau1/14269/Bobra.0368s0002.1